MPPKNALIHITGTPRAPHLTEIANTAQILSTFCLSTPYVYHTLHALLISNRPCSYNIKKAYMQGL